MKTVDFANINNYSYAITDISVIRQTNMWNVCSHPDGRGFNGFLFLISGNCLYTCGGETINLGSGGLIYLPKGAKHTACATEKTLDFYRINFTLTDLSDGEEIIFASSPSLITDSAPKNLLDICEKMKDVTFAQNNSFKNLSMLCEMLDYVLHAKNKRQDSRIGEAIDYINNHYTEEINISDLADLCFISTAHLFRLFKKEIGISPIDYKNALRINKAKSLLCDPECSVNEIAAMLGFENVCYFSRIFKKKTGSSPLEYRKENS